MGQTGADELPPWGRAMTTATPTLVPMLTRGKHRSPRKGACFMEFASYLAGEQLERPSPLHPPAAVRRRPAGQRQHVRRRSPAPDRSDPLGDRADQRRSAVERRDRPAGGRDRPARGQLRAPAGLGRRPADERAGARRARWATGDVAVDVGPETLTAVPSAERWARQYCGDRPVPSGAVPSAQRPEHRPARRRWNRRGLRSRPRRCAARPADRHDRRLHGAGRPPGSPHQSIATAQRPNSVTG